MNQQPPRNQQQGQQRHVRIDSAVANLPQHRESLGFSPAAFEAGPRLWRYPRQRPPTSTNRDRTVGPHNCAQGRSRCSLLVAPSHGMLWARPRPPTRRPQPRRQATAATAAKQTQAGGAPLNGRAQTAAEAVATSAALEGWPQHGARPPARKGWQRPSPLASKGSLLQGQCQGPRGCPRAPSPQLCRLRLRPPLRPLLCCHCPMRRQLPRCAQPPQPPRRFLPQRRRALQPQTAAQLLLP
jgi:hypothetical protein